MPRIKTPEKERFLAKAGPRPADPDTCWLWQGAFTVKNGTRTYGSFVADDCHLAAHRHSYRTFIGPLSPGDYVLHSCDTPACVNPKHLRVGTAADNAKDRDSRGRACRPGHPDHPQTKMRRADILAIRREAHAAATAKGTRYGVLAPLAKKYGISIGHVCKLCNDVLEGIPRYKVKGMQFFNRH